MRFFFHQHLQSFFIFICSSKKYCICYLG